MPLYTWWRGDLLPAVGATMSLSTAPLTDTALLHQITAVPTTELTQRVQTGNVAYVAWHNIEPVGYGWVARQQATIGELRHQFCITEQDRYLWDFATLPAWRGRGVYPYLLQGILTAEHAQRFWIMHAPENAASARGITKAGFEWVGTVSFLPNAEPGFAGDGAHGRARVGAALFGLPVENEPTQPALTPCWHCTMSKNAEEANASPSAAQCSTVCTCAAGD